MAWLRALGFSHNDTAVLQSKTSRLQKIFTAKHMERRISWPEPSAPLPPEQRWGLLGLGLCPPPRRRPAPRRETSLWACLQACDAESTCRSAAFSQSREICFLQKHVCAAASLSWHVSYATFVPKELLQTAVTTLELGHGERLRVYAYTTSVTPMVKAFVSSLQMAADGATLLLHHGNSSDQTSSYSSKTRKKGTAWPTTPEDHLEMRRRDRQKINMVARCIWDGCGSGADQVVLSDVDVQVFPGWTQLVRACTSASPVCVTQQPGLFDERTYPFNSGFLAFRADSTALAFALKLAAQYEPQFLITDAELLMRVYTLEQNVLSQFLFTQGRWFWGVFSPEYVRIMVDGIPSNILIVKVQHACGSRAGNRLASMYRVRRFYYSSLAFCTAPAEFGPQHPCCLVYGHQHSIFHRSRPGWPPFATGSIYGSPKDFLPYIEVMQDLVAESLPGSSVEQWDFWSEKCHSERMQRMYAWQLANPQDDFMNGQIQPLPPMGLG